MRALDRAFVKFFYASYKLPIAVCTLLRAADIGVRSAVNGFWLGVLTPHHFRCLDEWHFTQAFPQYLDSTYNRSGWFDWEEPVVAEYFANLPRVLVAAGAGAGREMLALRRMGVDAVGYEYNPALIELGRQLLREDGWEPSLHPAAPDSVGADAGEFDGIIIGWATYSLIAGRTARISLLRQARRCCRAGGPLLVSFFPREGDVTFFRASTAIANSLRTLLRRPKAEVGDTLAVSWTHRFKEDELREEFSQAGFRVVRFATEPYGHAVAIADDEQDKP